MKPKGVSLELANGIREAYKSGKMNQTQLAKKFKVSQSLVSKIVNNYIHKPPASDLNIGGSAEVKVGFNYGN